MKRREFITLLGSAALVLPFTAGAQQIGQISRIGYLGTSSPTLEGHATFALDKKRTSQLRPLMSAL